VLVRLSSKLLWTQVITRKTSTRDTVVYPVVRPSIELAYSTLWRPNGRGLHSTPFKWSDDQLEYHVFYFLRLSPFCEESPQLGVSRPYKDDHTRSTEVREGKSNTHKSQLEFKTQPAEFSTQMELKSLSQRIKRVKLESWCLGMIKECLGYSSMRLGVPFIAPRHLGAVWSQQGRQFLPSVGWCTGLFGAPPDRHCSKSGADLLPKLAQPTVATPGWMAHRTLSGAPSRPLRWWPLAYRTVRWIIAVHRQKLPRATSSPPDTVRCTTEHYSVHHRTVRCARRAEYWLLQPSHFLLLFSLILALRQIY
jgi:hypothetical protein